MFTFHYGAQQLPHASLGFCLGLSLRLGQAPNPGWVGNLPGIVKKFGILSIIQNHTLYVTLGVDVYTSKVEAQTRKYLRVPIARHNVSGKHYNKYVAELCQHSGTCNFASTFEHGL